MRWAARVDDNHAEIVEALRASGWAVLSTARLGQGTPDLIVSKAKRTVFLEVKDGKKPPSARRLTPDEAAFFDAWPGECYVVESVEQALGVLG